MILISIYWAFNNFWIQHMSWINYQIYICLHHCVHKYVLMCGVLRVLGSVHACVCVCVSVWGVVCVCVCVTFTAALFTPAKTQTQQVCVCVCVCVGGGGIPD